MSNSNQPKFGFSVEDYAALSLSVIDNEDYIRATNEDGPIRMQLPRGVYSIRAELNGRFVDTLVRHTHNRHYQPKLPERFTSATLPESSTSHEYYTSSAWQRSQEPTAVDIAWNGFPNAGLMLYVRTPDRKRASEINKAKTLSLRSLDGSILSDFNDADIDPKVGFKAWSAKLSSGVVILEHHGRIPRQLPIRLLDGFQTQIYLMFRGRPLFEDLRVFTTGNEDISSRKHRDPYNRNDEFIRVLGQVDAGLAALANETVVIGDRLVREFLNSKFQNPMLGLIGAYLMLLRRHRRLDRKVDSDLPRVVIDNLNNLIPNSADIAALKILAEPWLGKAELDPVQDVPLLRIGAETLISRAADEPEILPEGSILDAVSDQILGDTVWTSWKPIKLPVNVCLEISLKQNEKIGWVESSIADAIEGTDKTLDITDLAKRIGVTHRAVRDAYKNLVVRMDSQPEQIGMIGLDVKHIRRGLLNRVSDSLADSMRPTLNRLAEEAPLSYQEVYPKLKSAIDEIKSSKNKVCASDRINDIIDNWSDKALRSKMVNQLEKNLFVRLDDILGEFDQVNTVKDIASLVLRKYGS